MANNANLVVSNVMVNAGAEIYTSVDAVFSIKAYGAFAWRSEIDSTYEDITLEHEQESIDPCAGLSLDYALSQEWQIGLSLQDPNSGYM